MDSGSTVLRVSADPNGGWLVHEPGGLRALSRAASREAALWKARETLEGARGGVIEADEPPELWPVEPLGPKRPWWKMTRRADSAFLFGGLWTLFTLVRILSLDAGSRWYEVALPLLSAALSVGYLASGAFQVRWRRRPFTP